ncbi:hypothetical protein G7Y89_g1225 [Cudoniella acicularis]|uniref:2EXR domain-containing protein n=1 Tax=Cudoniella acicularis TaxID=354080 RepID=A0A8H4RXP5_9HELO|nr:hypothetical protein G7Y89_g1225 [Cudoniella acicularis]
MADIISPKRPTQASGSNESKSSRPRSKKSHTTPTAAQKQDSPFEPPYPGPAGSYLQPPILGSETVLNPASPKRRRQASGGDESKSSGGRGSKKSCAPKVAEEQAQVLAVEGSVARDFSLFSKLPIELRLKIWKTSMVQDGASIIEVRWNKEKEVYCTDPHYPLLRTCKESREEALDFYDLLSFPVLVKPRNIKAAFASTLDLPEPSFSEPQVTMFKAYIKLNRDILYLSSNHFENSDTGNPHPTKLNELIWNLCKDLYWSQYIRYLAFGGESIFEIICQRWALRPHQVGHLPFFNSHVQSSTGLAPGQQRLLDNYHVYQQKAAHFIAGLENRATQIVAARGQEEETPEGEPEVADIRQDWKALREELVADLSRKLDLEVPSQHEALSTGVIPQEFTLFLKLPPELQLKIWKEAVEQFRSRVIEVKTYRVRGYPKHSRPFTSQMPSILHACHDSRREALKVYQLLEVPNREYWGDDGLESDVEPDRSKHYYWQDDDYNRYNPKYVLTTHKSHEIVPTFRFYTDASSDTIYLHPDHNLNDDGVLDFMSHLRSAKAELQNVAFSFDVLENDD